MVASLLNDIEVRGFTLDWKLFRLISLPYGLSPTTWLPIPPPPMPPVMDCDGWKVAVGPPRIPEEEEGVEEGGLEEGGMEEEGMEEEERGGWEDWVIEEILVGRVIVLLAKMTLCPFRCVEFVLEMPWLTLEKVLFPNDAGVTDESLINGLNEDILLFELPLKEVPFILFEALRLPLLVLPFVKGAKKEEVFPKRSPRLLSKPILLPLIPPFIAPLMFLLFIGALLKLLFWPNIWFAVKKSWPFL
mmetsp:Transcript_7173/g.14138  ORF Transcript_7173/g.14138 Transcript_7173/m.14138 type:complete len:245 (-) Transcript_7173:1476-2210(-)